MTIKKPVAWIAALLALGVLGSQMLPQSVIPPVPLVSKAEAEMKDVEAGDMPDAADVHLITQPGRYGLGSEQSQSRYAIIDETLVRVDAKTLKVLSVMRKPVRILD